MEKLFLENLGSPRSTRQLNNVLRRWANLPIFNACASETVAERLVQMTLWHTYIFGRWVLPSYIGHVFLSLREQLPTDDSVGRALIGVASVGTGELATNNVFGRRGESHSHYWDMRLAYADCCGRLQEVEMFEHMVINNGHSAAVRTSRLWSPGMRTYAQLAERLTQQTLVTFILAAASEDTIRRGYETILHNLPTGPKFNLFRVFLERHIELDTGDHGPASQEWLGTYMRCSRPSADHIATACNAVTKLILARIASYDF